MALLQTLFYRRPSSTYLWIAVLIFAASNAVTRKVTEIGAAHFVNGRNPVSLCNVLFVGNLCALTMLLIIFRTWQQQVRQLTQRDWISLVTIAILAGALGPGLTFAALDDTTVTNVVLIGRLEPPLTLAFSVLLLKVRVNAWTVAGSIVCLIGVGVTTLASSSPMISLMGGWVLGRGELEAAIAALVLALATVISKTQLQHVPLGLFSIARTAIGTLVFFVLAQWLYGTHHFAEVFSPFLWKWMLLYGAVIVVAGQLFWFAGLRQATSAESSLASSFNPIAAIIMAYLILGEVPQMAQWIGGAIVLLGIILSLAGNLFDIHKRRFKSPLLEQQNGILFGFRGI